MKKYFILTFVLICGLMLSGAICKNTVEKTAEKSIEKATGDEADVDIKDDSIKINTNGGSMEAGEEVGLPDHFPSDVHVTDGTIRSSTTMGEDNFTVSIESSKSVSQIKEEYESKFAADGWDVSLTMSYEGGAMVGGEKDGRTATVTIARKEGDEQTTVVLGVSKVEN